MISGEMDAHVDRGDAFFERFKNERKKLFDSSDALERISMRIGIGSVSRSIDSMRDDLEQERIRLAVLGAFKRGKSTLINAFLGKDLLPVGVVPLTSIVTSIRHGDEETAEIHFLGGERRTVPVVDLPAFITEKGNPGNRKGVAEAEVAIDHDLLKNGVIIIDTPGVGSTHLHNTRMTKEFLERVDVAIFVIASDPPISQEELEFLSDVKEYASRIFFVLNKVDYMEGSEMLESMEFSSRIISSTLERESVKLYPVSAKTALRAKLKGDDAEYSSSGFPALERDISDFLREGKAGVILDSARRRLERAASEVQTAIEIEARVIEDSVEKVIEKQEWLKNKMVEVRRRMDDAESLVDGSIDRLIVKFERDLSDHVERVEPGLREEMERYIDRLDKGMGPAEYVEVLQEQIQRMVQECFGSYLNEMEADLNLEYGNVVSRFEGEVNDLLKNLRRELSEVLQVNIPDRSCFDPSIGQSKFRFGGVSLLRQETILPGELVYALPGPFFRRTMRNRALDKLSSELDRHHGMLRYDLSCRLKENGRRLRSKVGALLTLTLETIDDALKAAQGMIGAAAPEKESRIAELTELSTEIESLMGWQE